MGELAKKFEGLDERIEEEKKKFDESTKKSDKTDELNDEAYNTYNTNVNKLFNEVYNGIKTLSNDEREKIDLDYPNFPKKFIKQQSDYFKKGEIEIKEDEWENISLLDFGKDEFESNALDNDNVKDLSSLNTTTQLDSSEQTVYNSFFYKQWCDLFLRFIYYDQLKLHEIKNWDTKYENSITNKKLYPDNINKEFYGDVNAKEKKNYDTKYINKN